MSTPNETHYCKCVTTKQQTANDKAALFNGAQWNLGDQIRVRFLQGEESLRQRVRRIAQNWTAPGMANLQFQFVSEGPSEIRIAFQPGHGSWSYLGTDCRGINQETATMNYGWLTATSDDDELKRVVLHEFGHALGLIHEHQNPKGGIKWNELAVTADLSRPPDSWDEKTIRHNVLDHYPAQQVTATPVDKESIMMYPIPAAWTEGSFSANLNKDLSDSDRRFIHLAYA